MKENLLKGLKKECEKCKACELHKTRNNIVFADGNPDTAKIILIGEAPGENEDLQGKPFVGRAGKLLNEFLEKAGLNREKDLYIINTVKCRPPKNRIPSREEKAACEHFLIKQIEIINPKLILLCGATAVKSFIEKPMAISKIRGEIFDIILSPLPLTNRYSIDSLGRVLKGEGKIGKYKAMPIFHPSYLLRNHSIEENSPRWLMLNDLIKAKKLI